jgi:flavin reductase (DIM6/NTAB) family NADH-FMN oxidoreductase RutF/catechol 2,3-dioxygenase-like lactoylglutathione lyase family enzyme
VFDIKADLSNLVIVAERTPVMTNYGKVEMSPSRHDWQPVPLPEQVVLVTTVDSEGKPHIATKTRFSVISYGPPTILVLAVRTEYRTARNIEETGQFVINIPGDDLVATSWVIGLEHQAHGSELFDENGLTPIPAIELSPPRIAECRAHLECEVVELKPFDGELAVFGKIVAASMNSDIAKEDTLSARYKKLSPFFFLEAGWTASLGPSRSVEEPVPGPGHEVTILATADLNRAVAFYTEAFDWSIRVRNKTYVEFVLPNGRSLALCTQEGFKREVGDWPQIAGEKGISDVQVYFRCENLPRAIAKLHTAGARPLSKVRERDWGEEAAYFADPDGHVIAMARPAQKK